MSDASARAIGMAQIGMLANAALAAIKLAAGVVGHSYALVADAIESTFDVFGSFVVWSGLRISAQPADENHPYGHGKAEPLAAAVVSVIMIGAAVAIALEAAREIRTPHHLPAPWTLLVLGSIMLGKELLYRRARRIESEGGSQAMGAEAWHHRSDAITSAAAFIGISVALLGERYDAGPRWEQADDWAAIAAAFVILLNGAGILRPAVNDLMDRAPGEEIMGPVARAARGVEGVLAIEKLKVRRAGTGYFVDLHVQAAPALTLHDAHILSGKVKGAIRSAVPRVIDALIHMEPYEPADR